jgi:ABC-2 type transport system permease protein
MIGVIARKEITEYRRDGRILALLGLTATLLTIALLTGWATQTERQRQAQQLQRDDQATFVKQGAKPTHSAAHFGRMAYKPVPALAAFDPGSSPYLGQVIWLEAHRRGPAMFRPAEDALELRRLSDLSVAGILTLLLPLLIFLLAHGSIVGERERDTWHHMISSGAAYDQLFFGKLAAVATIGIGIALTAVATSVGMAVASSPNGLVVDAFGRGVGLIGLYSLYGLMLSSIALAVSARARSSVSALLILLSVWALSAVIAPRVAADVADRVHPTPDSAAFWKQTADSIKSSKPKRGSEAYRTVEREVLSQALGRAVTVDEASSLSLNRQGLGLEIGEIVGAKAFEAAYEQLYETYEAQQRVRRWFALLAPTISLQHVSSALAGTDVEAHRDFTRVAEQQRRLVLRLMNEDLMLRGVQAGDAYLSNRELWEKIPNFKYQPPAAADALRHVIWDIVVLILWTLAASCVAWYSVVRQRAH